MEFKIFKILYIFNYFLITTVWPLPKHYSNMLSDIFCVVFDRDHLSPDEVVNSFGLQTNQSKSQKQMQLFAAIALTCLHFQSFF